MATVPVPFTWTAGASATSTNLQTLTDSILYLLGSTTSGGVRRALFEGRQTVAQAALVTATWTDITFDTEDVDYDNGHSIVTNTARYTAQTAGYYYLGDGGVAYTANATGRRGTRWSINGTAVNGSAVLVPATAANETVVTARTKWVFLNAADYVTLQGNQESGGGLQPNVTGYAQPSMGVQWASN